MHSFLSADEIDETLKYTPSNGSPMLVNRSHYLPSPTIFRPLPQLSCPSLERLIDTCRRTTCCAYFVRAHVIVKSFATFRSVLLIAWCVLSWLQ
jgi:hypothetical protein